MYLCVLLWKRMICAVPCAIHLSSSPPFVPIFQRLNPVSLSLGGIHSCCTSPTWVSSSLAGAGKLFSFLCMKYKTFAENKTRPWELPVFWDSFCTSSPQAWTHPLCRGSFCGTFFLEFLLGKSCFSPLRNVWLSGFLWLWHSLFEISPALLRGNSFTSIVYIHYLFSIWRNWCCKLFREAR